jgi:UDP-N-acetylmuramate-alanine ligase
MVQSNSIRRMRRNDVEIDRTSRPDWLTGDERPLVLGEEAYCTAGIAHVAGVHGKTGTGSRLVELRLDEDGAKPFFAAASNILVAPR